MMLLASQSQSPRSIRSISVFNPATQTDDELRRSFIVRLDVLDDLLNVLQRESKNSIAKHQLLIGQRGMGKTTLLYRIALAAREDASLNKLFLPLNFPEEQYNVASLTDFWRNCFDALVELARAQAMPQLATLEQQQSTLRAANVLDTLNAAAASLGKRLLLLVDNLDMVFARISAADAWALRAVLQKPGGPLVIGAATQPLEESFDYDQAFYDFLQSRWLDQLSFDESLKLLLRLAQDHQLQKVEYELQHNPARLVPLHLFAGGNPRTVMLLFRVLAEGLDHDVQKDIEDLLDLSTPLYKARIESLPPQQQRVFITVALAFDPVTAAQVEEKLELGINATSAQLGKLVQSGLLRKAPSGGSKRIRFEVAERFFGIWYLMRANRHERTRMLWLARFMRDWYARDEKELGPAAERLLQSEAGALSAHTVLQMIDGLPALEKWRSAALERLPASDRHDYAWADLPKRKKQLSQTALAKEETQFSAITNGEYDWALPVLREQDVDLSKINNESKAKKLLGILLRDPTRIAKSLWKGGAYDDLTDGERFLIDLLTNDPALLEENLRWRAQVGSQDSKSLIALSSIYQIQGRYEEARTAIDQALVLEPGSASAWFVLGRLYLFDLKNKQKAIDALEAATRLDSTVASYWALLGKCLSFERKYARAEEAFRACIERDQNLAYVWRDLGLVIMLQLLQEHVQRAVTVVERLKADFPYSTNSFEDFNFSDARLNEANSAFVNAIVLDKSKNEHWEDLVGLWTQIPDSLRALTTQALTDLFTKACERQSLPESFDTLIGALLNAGKLDDTLAAMEQTDLIDRARPLVEALRMMKQESPEYLATLAAEVRDATYQVLKRYAPAFADRIARELPSLVATLTLPDRVKPLAKEALVADAGNSEPKKKTVRKATENAKKKR
jgi:tetratricopeptide (TPR) repeat protein